MPLVFATQSILIHFDIKVQRALKLWAMEVITLKMVRAAKQTRGRTVAFPKTVIVDGGGEESTSFNDVNWGNVTRSRMEFVNADLRVSSLEKIIEKAKELLPNHGAGGSKNTSDLMDVDRVDNQLVDLSDSDG
jgi:hypothetical protein